MKRPELMCAKLNQREARRTGVLPEKSIARKLSNFYTNKDGTVHYDEHHATHIIKFTVVGFDGHPFFFEVPPMAEATVNDLIAASGVVYGEANNFQHCANPDCYDKSHGDGCMVNIDLDTLDRLLPPNRFEYQTLTLLRMMDRADITFTTRFSCQIRITPELDGALIAMKQIMKPRLRSGVTEWGPVDDAATLNVMRSKRVEPWAPIMEEPTKRDFPIGFHHLWATNYTDLMAERDSRYQRKDGFHSKPVMWAHRV
eukprot:GILI01012264.1.p1 GENE.GILI01012264.1~~GILI01012264.1.p1  ORF type:complete len:283 (-),score=61.43 GILI01012264.1:234-1001(-)